MPPFTRVCTRTHRPCLLHWYAARYPSITISRTFGWQKEEENELLRHAKEPDGELLALIMKSKVSHVQAIYELAVQAVERTVWL